MNNLKVGHYYTLKGKNIRYEGLGKNTFEYIFRDKISGKIIFVTRNNLRFIKEK